MIKTCCKENTEAAVNKATRYGRFGEPDIPRTGAAHNFANIVIDVL